MTNEMSKVKVLVIDQSPEVLNTVSLGFTLRWPQCTVLSAGKGEQGISMVETETPHIIILEIDLPDMDGFKVIGQIRLFSDVPIIVLSARADELDIVRALELGADDFVIKPPSTLELLGRAKAVLRRSGVYTAEGEDIPPFVAENLIVDFSTKQVYLAGEYIHLTPIEYGILCQLVRNAGRVVSVEVLKQHVWGDIDDLRSSTIRKSVSQLRNKLGDSRATHKILNERGMGYKFVGQRQTDAIQVLKAHSQ